MEKLRERLGQELDYLIDAHETFQRMRFDTTALIDVFTLNYLNCDIIEQADKYLKFMRPVDLKRKFLIHSIAVNRLLTSCLPILEAITMFELRYSPYVFREEKPIFDMLLLQLEKDFWRANPKAKPFYDKIMWIYEKTANPEIPSWLVDLALSYVELKYPYVQLNNPLNNSLGLLPSYLIEGLPIDIDPMERFQILYDALQELEKTKSLGSLTCTRAIPDPWREPIEHNHKKWDFCTYIYSKVAPLLRIRPIEFDSVKFQLYKVMMKKVITREQTPIEKQKAESDLYESSLKMHIKVFDDGKWIILIEFRKDIRDDELWALHGHLGLTSLAHQIVNLEKQPRCCFQGLNICKGNCPKCWLGKSEKNAEKLTQIFSDTELPRLESIFSETKRQLNEILNIK